jgi:hypothetical protein
MLGDARRPPRPNYLAIACSALNELIKIDKRLRPFMHEEREKLARRLRDQEVRAALRKVYGEDPVAAIPSPPCNLPTATDVKRFFKQRLALAKSRHLIDRLKSRLRENW